MDSFGIPKKINRHVLKALYYMNECGIRNPDIVEICDLVEMSMKNTVPVRDLPGVVRQSLQNMAHLGVIEKVGMNFHVNTVPRSPAIPKNPNPKVFKTNDPRSRLDPNTKRRHRDSDESVSGNEMEKARKRFRSTRPVNRNGHSVVLPNVRTSRKSQIHKADLNQNYFSLSGDENQPQSDCSSETVFIGKSVSPEESRHEQKVEEKTSDDEKKNSGGQRGPEIKSEPDVEEIVTKELSVPEAKTSMENCDENANCSKDIDKKPSKTEILP